VMFFQQQAPLAETEGSPASFPRCWSPCRDLKAERHSVPHKPRSRLASLGLPALLASDPGRSHRERVGSDARSALFWPREARRLRTLQSQLCSYPSWADLTKSGGPTAVPNVSRKAAFSAREQEKFRRNQYIP